MSHEARSAPSRGDPRALHQPEYEATTAPPHADVFATTCEQCHVTEAWIPALALQHDWFLLQNRHAEIPCVDCHTVGFRSGDTPTECVGCHRADYDGAMAPPPTDCASCHSEAGCVLVRAALLWRGYEFYALDLDARVDHEDFRILSPGEVVGHGYGIVDTALFLVNLAYVVRRRFPRLPLGPMRVWLDLHALRGLVGSLLILFHGPAALGGPHAHQLRALPRPRRRPGAVAGHGVHQLSSSRPQDGARRPHDKTSGADLRGPDAGAQRL